MRIVEMWRTGPDALRAVGVALTLIVVACRSDGPVVPRAPVASGVDAYVAALPSWEEYSPLASEGGEQIGPTSAAFETSLGSVRYRCTTTPYSLTRNPEKIVTLDPDANVLWPGALIQGKGYARGLGSLLELPIRQRAPLEVTLDLLATRNTALVRDPTLGTVSQAVGDLIQQAETAKHITGSSISYSLEETHSVDQAMLGLGLSVKTIPVSVKASLDIDHSAASSSVTAYFVQRMFTVSVGLPQSPGDYFSDALTPAILQQHIDRGQIGPNNLPVYVANVAYGRILLFSMTSDSSYSRLVASLNATIGKDTSKLGAGVALDDTTLSVLRNSRINVVTIGGDGNNAIAMIQSGQLKDYFKPNTPLTSARPISYTLRNLGDNSIAQVSETSEYQVTECEPINVKGTLRINVSPNDASLLARGAGGYSSDTLFGDQELGELQPGGYVIYTFIRDAFGVVDTAWTVDTTYTEVYGGVTTDEVIGVRRKNEVGAMYRIALQRFDVINDQCARDFGEGEPEIQYYFQITSENGTLARTPTSNYADGSKVQTLDLTLDRPAYLAASTTDSTTITIYGKIKDYDPDVWPTTDDDETIGEFRISERYPRIATGSRVLTYKVGGCESKLTLSVTELVAF